MLAYLDGCRQEVDTLIPSILDKKFKGALQTVDSITLDRVEGV